MLNRRVLTLTTAAAITAPIIATPLAAQQAPAVHLVAAPTATSKQSLSQVTAVRQLPDGSLLVNDAGKRQLLLYDATLGTASVVADSVSGAANAYGPSGGAIVPYLADSTLFIDPRDLTMYVIGPTGAIGRIAAVPRSQDAGALGSNLFGSPALDPQGRLVYRIAAPIRFPQQPPKGGAPVLPDIPDTAAIVRLSLATRKVDTAVYYKIPQSKMTVTQSDRGMSITTQLNPMPIVDDWAVLSDGSIAVVRGKDYHVDFVAADGARTASTKIPFDWQQLTDDDKIAVIDSAKAAIEQARNAPPSANGANAANALGGGNRTVINMSVGGDGPARGATTTAGALPPINLVSPSELPDYRPAFTQGAAKADLDDNLWIRTTSVRAGAIAGPIYDVVNRQGQLVDRVQVPAGRTIVGFGKDGAIYLLAHDASGSWLERTHR
ncbi:MAG TPA: hypothetical protein VGM67_08710 [Gemmatimonadaceae bacterium]|jgi:hypothetical protein